MDPTTNPEILKDLEQKYRVTFSRPSTWIFNQTDSVFFLPKKQKFGSISDSKQDALSYQITVKNACSHKDDLLKVLTNLVVSDDNMKANIHKIYNFLSVLSGNKSDDYAISISNKLLQNVSSYKPIADNIMQDENQANLKKALREDKLEVGKIYLTFCQRIQHLFFLIWSTYKERVKLTLDCIDQIETVLQDENQVSSSSDSKINSFQVNQNQVMGILYQYLKTIEYLEQPVTVNSQNLLQHLVDRKGELKKGDRGWKDIVEAMVNNLTFSTVDQANNP